jgi:hypothetical protein
LFLDDERNGPDGFYLARSTAQAVELVESHGCLPEFMSLDHDLGGSDTTMEFLKWIAYEWNQDDAIPFYVVHSENPVGRGNIISFLESLKKAKL